MTFFNILSLVGGLALFLYGMDVMGKALEKTAGSKLKTILSKLTDNPLKGLLLGAGVTAVIQSSSATTVMVVGFINSGLMQLRQAIGIIMGANIGTTVTAWILSLTGIDSGNIIVQLLKPTSFTPILALIGIALHMFSKKDKKRNVGTILLGFAVLMFGMDTMSSAVKPLQNVPEFANLFTLFTNPILGVLVGAIVTAIIQSSSASVGILQALSATGSVTIASTIPIIMGQNIGTCITALISSVGTTKNARRSALVHLYFNIIGTVVGLALFYGLNAILKFEFIHGKADHLSISIVHTAFNVFCTTLLLPFIRQLEALAIHSIPDKADDSPIKLLDERLIATPTIAVEQGRKAACDMALLVKEGFDKAVGLLKNYSESVFNEVTDIENSSDRYEDTIDNFLVKVSASPLSDEDSLETYGILHSVTDFERIGDHALNIAESAKELYDKNLSFSDEAKRDLRIMIDAVSEIVELTMNSFTHKSYELAELVEPLEEVIDGLNIAIKNAHTKRLRDGNCTIEHGFILNDLLSNFERVADHCSNIAVCRIEIENSADLSHGNFDPHEYLSQVKMGENAKFNEAYNRYKKKYSFSYNINE